MASETGIDETTGRKWYLDVPADPDADGLTFLLCLHGGGSAGVWQRSYFPAHDFVDELRLVVANPTAKTATPMRHWDADADDEHLQRIVEQTFDRFGTRIRSFWLVGHSQGGMTSSRLLRSPFFADRVDGWLSLSGGRIGTAPFVEDFGPPRTPEEREAMATFMARRRAATPQGHHDADFSFIFAVGEHEIASLPDTSPWAERYGAGARVQLADVVDSEPGQIHDSRWNASNATLSWGREPRPGTAHVWTYPGARDGRVIADVVRVDKGHTEGLEPNITRALLDLIVAAPGGKAHAR
jgi:hypothetical protein